MPEEVQGVPLAATTPTTEVPTLEAVARWEVPSDQQVMAQSDHVRVTVRKDRSYPYRHIIDSNLPLPEKKLVIAELTMAQRKVIGRHYVNSRYYDLNDNMQRAGEAISNKAWANAIARATIQQIANKQDGTAEMRTASQPGYFVHGDTLYEMNPVAVVKTNKALAAVKRAARDRVKQWEQGYKQSVEAQAKGILEQAQAVESRMAEKLAELELRTSEVPPREFREGYPLRYSNGWQVGMWLNLRVREWQYDPDTANEVSWPTPPASYALAKPVQVMVWIPVRGDGSYNVTSMKVDNNHKVASPHLMEGHACLAPGDKPARLTAETYEQLKTSIERTLSVVNLSSCYTTAYWRDHFKAYMTPEIQAAAYANDPKVAYAQLAARTLAERQRQNRVAVAQLSPSEASDNEDREDTWQVER